MDHYQSYNRTFGYNIRIVAESNYGLKFSEEHKRKISESKKGKNGYWKNKKHSKETIEKIIKNHAHISGKDHYLYGKPSCEHPLYGTRNSKETIEKRRQKLIGRKLPDDTKKRISESRKGLTSGENHPCSVFTWEEIKEIRRRYKEGNITQKQLADEFYVDTSTICVIINNKRWIENDD